MNHSFILAGARGAAFVVLALAGTSAGAQQVGTYTGTTADGHAITVDVAQDPNTGAFYVSGVNAYYTMSCPKTGGTQEWGVGWLGNLATITAGSASANLLGINAFTNFSMTFSGTTDVSGKVRAGVPEYAGSTKSTQSCSSSKVGFTATFGASSAGTRGVAPGTRQITTRVDRGVVVDQALSTAH